MRPRHGRRVYVLDLEEDVHMRALLGIAVVGLIVAPVLSDWNHDVKWDQLDPQDSYGGASWVDYNTPSDALTADDFLCSETGWISDIEFWGWSIYGNEYIDSFRITFYSDVPASPGDASHPGDMLYDYTIGPVTDPEYPTLGWQEIETNHFKINLPEDQWFAQTAGNIYWIGIQGVMVTDGYFDGFYWNFRDRYEETWGDDAAFTSEYFGMAPWWSWGSPAGYANPDLYETTLPADWTSLDMSFRLTGLPIPEPASLLLVCAGILLARRR
jgi:hypothetical protein